MAGSKKKHSYTLKGVFSNENKVIAEYNKKTDSYKYYSVEDALAKFDGKEVSFSFSENDEIPTIDPDKE